MQNLPIIRGKETLGVFTSLMGTNIKYCGGYVRWAASPSLNPAAYGDLDAYAETMEQHEEAKKRLQGFIKKEPTFDSPVATSFTFDGTALEGAPKLQLIKPVGDGNTVLSGTLTDIIENFDFSIIRIGVDPKVSLDYALADDDFIQDEMNKVLNVKKIHCPISAIKRIAKYREKGYAVSNENLMKLFTDWDGRTPEYKKDLSEAMAMIAAGPEAMKNMDPATVARFQRTLYMD